jgi:hypothetical protein
VVPVRVGQAVEELDIHALSCDAAHDRVPEMLGSAGYLAAVDPVGEVAGGVAAAGLAGHADEVVGVGEVFHGDSQIERGSRAGGTSRSSSGGTVRVARLPLPASRRAWRGNS